MSLTMVYHTPALFNSVPGCPMLVSSAAGVDCTSASANGVFAQNPGSALATSHGYDTSYPLMLKLFCTNVAMTGTVAYPNPEFIVNVTGPASCTVHRIDEKNFSLALKIKDWNTKSLDTTLSITPIPPLTGVSFNCLAGLAYGDNQDRSPEY